MTVDVAVVVAAESDHCAVGNRSSQEDEDDFLVGLRFEMIVSALPMLENRLV